MLIALIDDGIDTTKYKGLRVKHDLQIGRDCVVRERPAEHKIITDHGTTCAGIILKYSPWAEFCSIRVFHQGRLRTTSDQIVAAMEWCLEQRIPIIHLSLGSSQQNDFSKLRLITAKLLQRNHIIIAAKSNDSKYSIPACLSGVLGVAAEPEFEGNMYKLPNSSDDKGGLIRASSRHNLRTSNGIELMTLVANSYAAPTVTAAVHNILNKYGAFSMMVSQIYSILSNRSDDINFSKPDFIEDACIINPSAHSIYKEHLFFRCIAESSRMESIRTELDTCKSIVYLPPHDTIGLDKVNVFLQEMSSSITTLLYGGHLPKELVKAYGERMLIWTEDSIECEEHQMDSQYEASSVMIHLHGDREKVFKTLFTLRSMFIGDGYLCRGLTDDPYFYLYDLEYVSVNTAAQSAIKRIESKYSPDVIISSIQDAKLFINYDADAYHVFLGNLQLDHPLPKEQTSFLSSLDDLSLQSTYKEILNYFLK